MVNTQADVARDKINRGIDFAVEGLSDILIKRVNGVEDIDARYREKLVSAFVEILLLRETLFPV